MGSVAARPSLRRSQPAKDLVVQLESLYCGQVGCPARSGGSCKGSHCPRSRVEAAIRTAAGRDR
jgi:hypothetical protein